MIPITINGKLHFRCIHIIVSLLGVVLSTPARATFYSVALGADFIVVAIDSRTIDPLHPHSAPNDRYCKIVPLSADIVFFSAGFLSSSVPDAAFDASSLARDIYAQSRHPADLVAADYYEQEVRYQGQIDRVQRAQQRAELASVAYNSTSKQITISLPTDAPLTNVTGTITLYRPSAIGQDRTFKFEPGANGVQILDASGLLTGLWKVRVSWTMGQEDYFLDQKVVIPAKAS